MVRVLRRPPSARKSPGRAAKGISQKHKVIMESVTQERKKLRSIISFEAKAPPGYTFIPAGNPKLTNACKESCRKDGLRVFAVTTTPHARSHNLSQHVHRIGYHFPSTVVATACMDLGLYLTATGKAVSFYNVGNNEGPQRNISEISQITINTEARDVLRDLFPNIPDSDLNQIIKTAFQKGQRRVGTAVELPLARRAQLAAVAHIRHVYTDYDRLLKITSFHDARSLVEESTLAKLVEWRGDDENGKTVLEDVFREVIVISDGDDDREEEDDPLSDRDQSVEIISSNPVHGELQTRPINYTSRPLREPLRELSDDDEPPGFRVVPDIPRRDKIDRRGFSRYQAWDRAIKRYRQRANGLDLRSSPRICHTDYQLPLRTMEKRFFGNIVTETEPVGFCRVYTGPFTGFGAGSGRREMPGSNSAIERRVSFGEAYFFIITPNCKFSEADNPLLTPNEQYEPYPPVESFRQARHLISSAPESSIQRVPASSDEKRLLEQGGPADVPIFVSHLRESPGFNENQEGRHSGAPITYLDKRWLKPQDRALPSIEGSLSPRLQAEPLNHDRLKHMAERMSDESSIHPLTSCQLRSNIPRPLDEDEYKFLTPKRRRVAPEETIRHDPGRMSHGAARPATFNAPKDTFPDEPFTSQGHISARRSPAEGDSPIRRSHAVPAELRYLERYQPEALLAPHSTHPTTKTGSLSGQGPADHTDTQFSHNHEPGLYSYRSGSAWPYKGPGTSAVIQGPMYFRGSRAGGVHCEEQGLPIKCMNTIGQSELQVSSVPHRANDYSAGFDDSYRRRQLYAEDFVRPVDLADSDPLELASRPHHRARLAKEASASGHDMPGNSVLSLHGNLRRFDSRGAFPVYGNASVGYNQNMAYYGRDIGGPYDSSGTANQLARRHPALIRKTPERLPGPAESDGGHVRMARNPARYSIPGDRATIIVD